MKFTYKECSESLQDLQPQLPSVLQGVPKWGEFSFQ